MDIEKLKEFILFSKQLSGDEKGEAQIFCDRFFKAFGHQGIIEANGSLEARIKFDSGTTKFADCIWSPPGKDGVLIEMKKKKIKNLESHFPQARDYWIEMNPEVVIGEGSQKPKYIILCNFDTFIIYNQLTFVDKIRIDELVDRSSAFNFMLPNQKQPIFNHNVESISSEAAKTIGELFKYLIFEKKEDRDIVQKFLLQCVLSMFSEDFNLLPDFIFTETVQECIMGASSYDLLGGLFRQMSNPKQAKAGRYKKVPYFNGGLFDNVDPLELDTYSLHMLFKASNFNWKFVNPAIFGSLFEGTMNSKERHIYGAHFTSEEDILKIINPSVIRPWKEKINKAKTLTELNKLLTELSEYKVLDPSCGSGNFLFIAYRSLKDLEMSIIEKINDNFSKQSVNSLNLGMSKISTKQFLGIDIQPIAVEVAKMTMMLAKELASDEWNKRISPLISTLGLSFDVGLPLDRLDDCIVCKDSLLEDWPEFDVIVGNPPYQSKNKMKQEMDHVYIDKIREKFPTIPGRADFCVYWFKKANDLMKNGQRAGLVGTNTIKQNYSRIGGLDDIISNNGIITDAISSQVWSGDAVVYVSIVNWIKGKFDGEKTLIFQDGDNISSPFKYYHPQLINSSLSLEIDLSKAKTLNANKKSKTCLQGQTHGHKGFLIPLKKGKELLELDSRYSEVLFPFLNGDELVGNKDSLPKRFVIDFSNFDIFEVNSFKIAYEIIKSTVYPDKEKKMLNERDKNEKNLRINPNMKVNHDHESAFKSWWKLFRSRRELIKKINNMSRYCVCSRVTKRPIFEFVNSSIHPNDAIQTFLFEDDYSFGILNSIFHWEWFKARCSTLKGDWRYTPQTVFDSFPWPQKPTKNNIELISKLAIELRKKRREIMKTNNWSLRDLYKIIETTPHNPITEIQISLDKEVSNAYGIEKHEDILEFLYKMNRSLSEREENNDNIQGPGFPDCNLDVANFISNDSVSYKE